MLIMKKKTSILFCGGDVKVQWNHCVWINVQGDTPLPRNFCFYFFRLVDVVFLTPDICMVSSCSSQEHAQKEDPLLHNTPLH